MAEAVDYKYIGTSPVRPDGVDKVTGRAQFAADQLADRDLVCPDHRVGTGLTKSVPYKGRSGREGWSRKEPRFTYQRLTSPPLKGYKLLWNSVTVTGVTVFNSPPDGS